MYLDNVIKSAQVAAMPQITYSEIVEDTLHMVEVEGAGQMALLKAEASAHILGSEAPADWWVKIKTVARKIFEMLKNLITKVFAYIKAIPTKVGSLITRLLTKWEKLGMKSKIERLNKKTGLKVRYATAQDVKGRDFGPLFAALGDAKFPAKGNAVKSNLDLWAAATKSAIDAIAKLSKDDNDQLEEQVQKEKEKVIEAENRFKDSLQDFKKEEWKPFDSIFSGEVKEDTAVPKQVLDIIQDGWNLLKNRTIEKNTEKEVKKVEDGVRGAASSYRVAMASYERHVRDENEDGVRNALDAAKNLRAMIATNGRVAAQIGSLMYKDALIIAKVVNAGISCCKGGESTGKKEFH